MTTPQVPPHALVTGPISGRIPTPHEALAGSFLDVTPDVLYFHTPEEVAAAAEAIELEHHARGTHPIQAECAYLDDVTQHPNGVDAERRATHKAVHAEINARVAEANEKLES